VEVAENQVSVVTEPTIKQAGRLPVKEPNTAQSEPTAIEVSESTTMKFNEMSLRKPRWYAVHPWQAIALWYVGTFIYNASIKIPVNFELSAGNLFLLWMTASEQLATLNWLLLSIILDAVVIRAWIKAKHKDFPRWKSIVAVTILTLGIAIIVPLLLDGLPQLLMAVLMHYVN
jgi:hypothetical protein